MYFERISDCNDVFIRLCRQYLIEFFTYLLRNDFDFLIMLSVAEHELNGELNKYHIMH